MATFPNVPLPLVAAIAPGCDPAAPSGYAWTDISGSVRAAAGVTIQSGRQDETALVDATSMGATIDNTSGNFSPRNPLGTWYGTLTKGTPAQIRVTRINDQFARTVASGLGTDADSGLPWTAGSSWAVNGSAATVTEAPSFFTIARMPGAAGHDVDITNVASLSAVATGASWVHGVLVRYADANNYYHLQTEFGTGGAIGCKIVRFANGVNTDLTPVVSAGVTYAAGTQITTRVRAVGAVLQIKAWLTSGSEPAAWTVTVTDSPSTITGTVPGFYEWNVGGNTNSPQLICTIDSYRVDVIRSTTPVPEWPTRWNQAETNITAPITGGGILRRLGQGASALRSPMYRQLQRYNPAGFWPLEDDSSATAAASAVSGGSSAAVNDVTFGADGPPGASSAVTLNSTASFISGGVLTGPTTASGYAAMVLMQFSSMPTSETTLVTWSATGTVATWRLTGDATALRLYGYGPDGTLLVSPGSGTLYGINPQLWFAVQLETNVSGGTVSFALDGCQVGSTTFLAFGTGSYSGTAPKLTGWKAGGLAGCSYSMSWLGDNSLPFVDSTFLSISSGYAGELAANRITRLAAEENVPMLVIGDTARTAAMGVQTADTFLNLVRECEAADQGVLHERGGGLAYLTRFSRYNTAPVMALDFAQGHLAAPPEPTDDDQQLVNQVQLSRKGGSQATVQNNASIALSGIYPATPTVNLATDAALAGHAAWRLHLGTADETRWPSISLSLHMAPSLIPAWCSVRQGSRITIANPPAAYAGDVLDLIVEGWTETLGLFTWDVVLNCSPARPWDTGIYGGIRRCDSASTTLASSAAAGVVSLSLTTTLAADIWSTKAGSLPYDLIIAGERVTVTAMTAASGTGPYTQTATVTRAVNGIAKLLPANSPVHVYQPARWAL